MYCFCLNFFIDYGAYLKFSISFGYEPSHKYMLGNLVFWWSMGGRVRERVRAQFSVDCGVQSMRKHRNVISVLMHLPFSTVGMLQADMKNCLVWNISVSPFSLPFHTFCQMYYRVVTTLQMWHFISKPCDFCHFLPRLTWTPCVCMCVRLYVCALVLGCFSVRWFRRCKIWPMGL